MGCYGNIYQFANTPVIDAEKEQEIARLTKEAYACIEESKRQDRIAIELLFQVRRLRGVAPMTPLPQQTLEEVLTKTDELYSMGFSGDAYNTLRNAIQLLRSCPSPAPTCIEDITPEGAAIIQAAKKEAVAATRKDFIEKAQHLADTIPNFNRMDYMHMLKESLRTPSAAPEQEERR